MINNIILIATAFVSGIVTPLYDFDMTRHQPSYTDSLGYGYDCGSVALSKKHAAPMFLHACTGR